MKCFVCKHGETRPGTASITLERQGMIIVIQNVPGEICEICGEAYHSEHVTSLVLKQAEQAYRDGIGVAVAPFKKAA